MSGSLFFDRLWSGCRLLRWSEGIKNAHEGAVRRIDHDLLVGTSHFLIQDVAGELLAVSSKRFDRTLPTGGFCFVFKMDDIRRGFAQGHEGCCFVLGCRQFELGHSLTLVGLGDVDILLLLGP